MECELYLNTTFLKREVQDTWESKLEYARGGGRVCVSKGSI